MKNDDRNGTQSDQLEDTRPEPDSRAEPPAEQHRAEGNLRRGLTTEQQRDELTGDGANRRELRRQAEQDIDIRRP